MPEQPASERKIRLALIFGGQSAEHEVSLASARSVLRAVDPTRYEVLPSANEHYIAESLRRCPRAMRKHMGCARSPLRGRAPNAGPGKRCAAQCGGA